MSERYTPRLSIEVTEEQQRKLSELIPWGHKRALFSTVIDGLIGLIEEYGQPMIAVIISGKLTIAELIDLFERRDESGPERT